MSNFPVKNKDFQSVDNIFLKEGYPFSSSIKRTAKYGHIILVNSVTIIATGTRREGALYEAYSNASNTLKLKKGHNITDDFYLKYSKNTKPRKITNIDTSDPNFDLITLDVAFENNILIDDYVFQDEDNDKMFTVFLGTTFDGGFVTDLYAFTSLKLPINTAITIPIKMLLTNKEAIYLKQDNAEPAANVQLIVNGIELMGDANFHAPKVIYSLGHSVADLSAYVSRFDGHMFNIAKGKLNENGLKYRIVGDTMPGLTSTQLIDTLKEGRKIVTQSDILIFNHGINDAFQNTTDQQWQENIAYFIAWGKKYYPKSVIVLLGDIKVSNNHPTENTRLDQLRTILATYEDTSKKIYYFGLDTIVLPNYDANSTYFVDGVHLTQEAHDIIGEGLGAFLASIPNI